MKKLLLTALILGLSLMLCLAAGGCTDIAAQLTAEEDGDAAPEEGAAEDGSEENAPLSVIPLALITSAEGVEDRGFAAAAWDAISAYGEENDLAADFYPAEEENQAARLDAVGRAVENGAQIIVCAGAEYGDTVYEAQFLYPEIGFVLCDGEPHSLDFTQFEVAPNTYAVLYTDREAGYLAGYSLVAEGYTKIGFMGGMAVPASIRSGAGFIQGVNQAATEKGTDVELHYTYSGLLQDDAAAQNLAGSWYANGLEAIFACGDFAASVCSAAEAAGGHVIACDTDQYYLSDAILSSTVKDIRGTVYQAVGAWYAGSFWGGKQVTLGLSNNAVKLAMENERYANFSAAEMRMLLNRIEKGEIEITTVSNAGFDLSTLCGPRVKLILE